MAGTHLPPCVAECVAHTLVLRGPSGPTVVAQTPPAMTCGRLIGSLMKGLFLGLGHT